MRPPSDAGPAVEDVVARIHQFSPMLAGRNSLPPIVENNTTTNEAPVIESFLKTKAPVDDQDTTTGPTISSSKPLPSISPKLQSFNKALEHITRSVVILFNANW